MENVSWFRKRYVSLTKNLFFVFIFSRQSEVSDCGKYLFLSIRNSCHTNLFFYVDLEKTGDIRGKLDIVRIIENFESDYEVKSID